MSAARAVGAHDFIELLPGGLRHRREQARRAGVGRPAPADLVRPGVPRRSGGADPRRGDRVAGHPERARGAGGAADAARRPDRDHHRPPPVDGGDRRPRAGDGARPDRGGRRAGRPDRRHRPLRESCTPPGATPSSDRGICRCGRSATEGIVQDRASPRASRPRRGGRCGSPPAYRRAAAGCPPPRSASAPTSAWPVGGWPPARITRHQATSDPR